MDEMKLKIKRGIILNEDNLNDLKIILAKPDMGWEEEGLYIYTTAVSYYIYKVDLTRNIITMLEIEKKEN